MYFFVGIYSSPAFTLYRPDHLGRACLHLAVSRGLSDRLYSNPEVIGSHWRRAVEADVVAVIWHEHVTLVGECRWCIEQINRQVVRQLLDHILPHTIAVLPEQGAGWRAIPALFARSGPTANAQALLHEHDGMLIDLPILYADLGTTTSET